MLEAAKVNEAELKTTFHKIRNSWLTARRRAFEAILGGEEDVAKLDAIFNEDASALAPAYVDDRPPAREELPGYQRELSSQRVEAIEIPSY